ncbi:MAG: sodium:proton antiporter [Ilumatobacteraceae bacterium]|nr:sodium:proton antiporter [Ilumatobacteraceae bacterium]
MFSVALLLVLIVGMGATVLAFAARSLRHEPYQRRFLVVGTLIVASGVAFAVTSDLVVLALAWIVTSALTVELIKIGPGRGAERAARARRSFLVGDAALVGAVVILAVASGGTEVAQIDRAGSVALGVAGVLLVIAAAARSAAGPFVRWLPDSLGAPTPSSALLHAGVVNGGAVLLIKLAPASAGTLPAAIAALVIGGVTCALAQAVVLSRVDVKGRLAWSTVAQMSFTLVLCGLGLHVAALLHLVAHGFYKGALFLGSGTGVRAAVRRKRAPRAWQPGRVSAFVLPGMAGLVMIWALADHVSADLLVPTGLAWIASGFAARAWMGRARTWAGRVGAAAAGSLLLAVYLLVTSGLERLVRSQVAVDAPVLSAWWVVPVLVAFCAGALAHTSAVTTAWARAAGRPTASRPTQVAAAAGPVRADRPSSRPPLNQLGA